MSDHPIPMNPGRRREGPRVERPTFRHWMRDDDPTSSELEDLAEREEMLRRAAQRMLDEAERLHQQYEQIRDEQRSKLSENPPSGTS